jgi:hypothetical protein
VEARNTEIAGRVAEQSIDVSRIHAVLGFPWLGSQSYILVADVQLHEFFDPWPPDFVGSCDLVQGATCPLKLGNLPACQMLENGDEKLRGKLEQSTSSSMPCCPVCDLHGICPEFCKGSSLSEFEEVEKIRRKQSKARQGKAKQKGWKTVYCYETVKKRRSRRS